MTEQPPGDAQDPVAWEAGFAAGRMGRKGNPYPSATREAWSWSAGSIEGEAKREAGFGPPRAIPND